MYDKFFNSPAIMTYDGLRCLDPTTRNALLPGVKEVSMVTNYGPPPDTCHIDSSQWEKYIYSLLY